MAEDKEIYYEMLWDCSQCNTKALLGDSHRHCPTCGGAQDPTKRYFPKPGEEVEARNHQFVGTDWSCAYCSSPNSAAAAHCTNCGAGKDGTKPVAIVTDTATAKPVVPSAPPAPRFKWLRWVLGAVALLLVGFVFLFSTTRETSATVSTRNWQREIQIEQLASVAESAWCDSVPMDAYSVSRSREQRSTRKVEDGQVCQDQRIDKGDGTFVKRKECTPRYREEPIYDDRCRFQVNRWRNYRSVTAGPNTSATPAWPSVGRLNGNSMGEGLGALQTLGAEREGARRESYTLTLTAGGKNWTCNVAQGVWEKYREGTTTPLKVRMTGGADCSSLK